MNPKLNPKIALVGNPNSGKTSLFNQLTGLNQHVGNYPGVTVDLKSGHSQLDEHVKGEIIDLPGTYSLYPRSKDERVVFETLNHPDPQQRPDAVVVVVDLANLKRNLLLFTQIKDMGLPTVLALNMVDVAEKEGIQIDLDILRKRLGVKVVAINARKGEGMDKLKCMLGNTVETDAPLLFNPQAHAPEVIEQIKERFSLQNDYAAYQLAQQYHENRGLTPEDKQYITSLIDTHNFRSVELRSNETIERYRWIDKLLEEALTAPATAGKENFSRRLDRVFTHKVWGYLIFLTLNLLIFQAIFAWATLPMDAIDGAFAALSAALAGTLPEGPLSSLLTEGIIPGIGGVVIFIPQIAILFAFIALLEETGYMSRVVFLMDRLMRPFGLNGKSVVPLLSGMACAIPAIMATRTIESWKERLITILVTPLMSCSARLPVYTILIALVIPEQTLLGVFNLQGLVLMGLYLLGFFSAILSAYVMKFIIKAKERSILIMELPLYKVPRWKNVGQIILEKVRVFVFQAGKVIIAISIILWVLASYGPPAKMRAAEGTITQKNAGQPVTEQEYQNQVAAYKLENSYVGHLGKFIEPVIAPLGYDWKIGIALITSFAAREVFVGTMATIYSIGADEEDEDTIKEKMAKEKDPDTGRPKWTLPLGVSLLVFYVFAMQCMSTLAVAYRETKSIKWPLIMTLYMTGLAYLSALVAFNLLS